MADVPPPADGESDGESDSAVQDYNLGLMFRQYGDDSRAEPLLRRAMASGHPVAAPAAAATLGMLLIDRGDPDAALTVYRMAIGSGDPDAMPNAAFNTGVLLRKRNDLFGAEAAYRQALASGHPHWATLSAMSLALICDAKGDLDDAVAFLERVVELGGPSGEPAAAQAAAMLAEFRSTQRQPPPPPAPSSPPRSAPPRSAPPRSALQQSTPPRSTPPRSTPHRSTPSSGPRPIEVPAVFARLIDAAGSAGRRFAESGDPGALDGGIRLWQEIIGSPAYRGADDSFRGAVYNSLSTALGERFRLTRQLADVHDAVDCAGQAVRATPDGAPELAKRLNNVGAMLAMRYQHANELVDLDAAVDSYERALAAASPGEQLLISAGLVGALQMRYERTGDPIDLDAWIATATATATRAPGAAGIDWPGMPDLLRRLSTALVIRYERDSDPRDLDAAIAAYEDGAVAASQTGSALLAALLVGVATNSLRRFRRTPDVGDLDRAVHAAEVALTQVASTDPLHPAALLMLGQAAQLRYSAKGRLPDLEQAITAFRTVVERSVAERDDALIFAELAASLSDRAEAVDDLDDQYAAIAAYRRAVDLTTEPGHRRVILTGIGAVWTAIYERTGESASLANSIDAHDAALAEPAGDDEGLPMTLINLGGALTHRFRRSGAQRDLDRAAEILEQAAAHSGVDSTQRAGCLNNLGAVAIARYDLLGQRVDLDRAVRALRAAVDLEPPQSPNAPSRLSNLGAAHQQLYLRTGALQHLDDAIACHRAAVAATPSGSIELAMHLNNLANVQGSRFTVTGDQAAIDLAVRHREQAVELTPPTSPELPLYLSNLGNAILDSAGPGGPAFADREAVERAVAAHRRAVDLTPVDAPERITYVAGLANGLYRRFVAANDGADLEVAIGLQHEVLERVGSEAVGRWQQLAELGLMLGTRFMMTADPADAERSNAAYRESCRGAGEVRPAQTLSSAQTWGRISVDKGDYAVAAEAYRFAVQAMQTLHQRQALREEVEHWLRRGRDLSADAAHAMVRGGTLEEAVQALEAGRAVVVSEAVERTRADLSGLSELGHGALGVRFIEAADRLTAATTTGTPPHHPALAGRPSRVSQRDEAK